jgi:hypothetical protein
MRAPPIRRNRGKTRAEGLFAATWATFRWAGGDSRFGREAAIRFCMESGTFGFGLPEPTRRACRTALPRLRCFALVCAVRSVVRRRCCAW